MEPAKLSASDDYKEKKKRAIIVASVVIVLALVAFAGTFSYSAKTVNVVRVEMQINYAGGSGSYFGPSVQYLTANYETLYAGENFSYSVTFTNHGTSPHTIHSLNLNTDGFSIVSTSKGIPLTVQPGASQTVILVIHLPKDNFSGNLNLTVSAS